MSLFELLLFFGKDEFYEVPLKEILGSIQECHDLLNRYDNTDLRLLTCVIKAGGPWEDPVLQAILKGKSEPQDIVDKYLRSENQLFFELRVRYLIACERIPEAMALITTCLSHPEVSKNLYYHQAYFTCLHMTHLTDQLLHEHVLRIDCSDGVQIICNTEKEGKTALAFQLSEAFLITQLQSGDMYCLWDLIFIWSKLQLKINPSTEVLVEQCYRMLRTARNVKVIFPFMKAITNEVGETGLQLSVELCGCALQLDLHDDPETKSLIYKTIACLLPTDLEICRICVLSVFFLERTIESYYAVERLYKCPDEDYNEFTSCAENRVRFELLPILKRGLLFDPEFWNFSMIQKNCVTMLGDQAAIVLFPSNTLVNITDAEIVRQTLHQDDCVPERSNGALEHKDPSSSKITIPANTKKNHTVLGSNKMDHNVLRHHCTLCNKEFLGGHIFRHAQAHQKKGCFSCVICARKFRNRVIMLKHLKNHIKKIQRQHMADIAAASNYSMPELSDTNEVNSSDTSSFSIENGTSDSSTNEIMPDILVSNVICQDSVPASFAPVQASFAPVPESFALVPESFALVPESYPPVPESYPPVPESYPPVLESYPLVPESYPPIPESYPPVPECYAPVPESYAPVPESYAPVPESYAPVPESYAPVPESYAPVPESYAPVPESYAPVPESYAPVPESYAPVPESYALVPESYAPVPESYAPVENYIIGHNSENLNHSTYMNNSDYFFASDGMPHGEDSLTKDVPVYIKINGSLCSVNEELVLNQQGNYNCPAQGCDRVFQKIRFLNKHARKAHPTDDKVHQHIMKWNKGKCRFCQRKFTDSKHFIDHLKRHVYPNTYFCQHFNCNTRFKLATQLTEHMSSHESFKAQCSYMNCCELFEELPELYDHESRHYEQNACEAATQLTEMKLMDNVQDLTCIHKNLSDLCTEKVESVKEIDILDLPVPTWKSRKDVAEPKTYTQIEKKINGEDQNDAQAQEASNASEMIDQQSRVLETPSECLIIGEQIVNGNNVQEHAVIHVASSDSAQSTADTSSETILVSEGVLEGPASDHVQNPSTPNANTALTSYGVIAKRPYFRPLPPSYLDERYISMPKRRKTNEDRTSEKDIVCTKSVEKFRCGKCLTNYCSSGALDEHVAQKKCQLYFGFDSDDESAW
ncbi:zinc finger protein 654 isoform X2 [Ascaphus truei]|uniref:zinc finger protein 654 isoform X2 n=1 Tax=Ascaphus truei TaxID=8439 RepID=UPI003F59D874